MTAATTANLSQSNSPAPQRYSIRGWMTFLTTSAVMLGAVAVMLWPDASPIVIGTAAIVMMIAMLFMRFPTAICMAVPSLIAMYAMRGWRLVESSMTIVPYEAVASWSLSVLPMFILMGLLMWRSGITESAYEAGKHWLAWLPGGLAVGTNIAGTGLATVSGSSTGVIYALGRVGVPEMLRAGYSKTLAVGGVLVASLPGQLIPPSILLVLYAGIAEVQVSQQLLAGLIPGVFVGLCFSVALVLIAAFDRSLKDNPAYVASRKHSSWKERWQSLLATWPVVFLGLVIVVGMFSGVVTATEAGALAAFGALILSLIKRGSNKSPIVAVKQACIGAVTSVGSIFFLLVGVDLLARMATLTGMSVSLTDLVIGMDLSRFTFLLVMMVIYLLLGAFMEPLAMMVLTVPILIPTLEHLDISLLWYGVFVVFMGEIAVLTPPIGILSMIIHSIVKDPEVNQGVRITLGDVFLTSLRFIPMAVVVVLILILWPDLVTWLPGISRA